MNSSTAPARGRYWQITVCSTLSLTTSILAQSAKYARVSWRPIVRPWPHCPALSSRSRRQPASPPVGPACPRRRGRGTRHAAQLRAIEDDAIREVVRMQEDVGLQAATDGEFRRALVAHGLHLPARRRRQVRRDVPGRDAQRRRRDRASRRRPSRSASSGCRRAIFADDFTFLKDTTTVTPKLTIPSPSMVHYRGGPAAIDPSVYPTMDEFWDDLSAAYAEGSRGARRAGVHVSAVRRHEPRLPQRPGRAGRAQRAAVTTPSISICGTSARSTPPSRAVRRRCG